jgi:hypothetical protein
VAVVVGDMLAVVAAFAASQAVWPMLELPWVLIGPSGAALAWPLILAALGCYTRVGLMARDAGRRLYLAVLTLVALFAVVAAALNNTVPRTTVVIVAPLVLLMSFVAWSACAGTPVAMRATTAKTETSHRLVRRIYAPSVGGGTELRLGEDVSSRSHRPGSSASLGPGQTS